MNVPAFAPPSADHRAGDSSSPCALGLYIHVPFCVRKCAYCSFYSVAGKQEWFERYVDATLSQIRQASRAAHPEQYVVNSIFFGGGTPTVLPVKQLVRLLQQCCRSFAVHPDTVEVSIEVNPATMDYGGFGRLREAGFNRLSLGIQSFNDRELAAIGRLHTAQEAEDAVKTARRAGWRNLSIDLMYGLPGQDVASWQQTLEHALALRPDHLSIYELTLEPGTPLARQVEQGLLALPREEEILAMHELTRQMVARRAMERYEISNYARPGYACRHNINYWHNGSYLGFGPGSVSCTGGIRRTLVADVHEFCRRLEQELPVISEEEELSGEERFRETVIMGLRMISGISLQELEQRFAINATDYYGPVLKKLVAQQLLELDRERMRLTDRGLLLANTVMAELV